MIYRKMQFFSEKNDQTDTCTLCLSQWKLRYDVARIIHGIGDHKTIFPQLLDAKRFYRASHLFQRLFVKFHRDRYKFAGVILE